MMKLFHAQASPFARKVRVLLAEIGQTDAVDLIAADARVVGDVDSALVAANPLGKIPALVRPDGPAIYDSRVICRYLDATFRAGLYPETRLWEVLTLEATADAICDAAVLMVYETRYRPEDQRYAPWVDGQWAKIDRALDAIEASWTSHLSGKLTMAQIALGCALAYLDFRHGDRDWRRGRPELAGWIADFAARPSMLATAPPMT